MMEIGPIRSAHVTHSRISAEAKVVLGVTLVAVVALSAGFTLHAIGLSPGRVVLGAGALASGFGAGILTAQVGAKTLGTSSDGEERGQVREDSSDFESDLLLSDGGPNAVPEGEFPV